LPSRIEIDVVYLRYGNRKNVVLGRILTAMISSEYRNTDIISDCEIIASRWNATRCAKETFALAASAVRLCQ